METYLINTALASLSKGYKNKCRHSKIKLRVVTGHLVGKILIFKQDGSRLIRALESSKRRLKNPQQTLKVLSLSSILGSAAMSQ